MFAQDGFGSCPGGGPGRRDGGLLRLELSCGASWVNTPYSKGTVMRIKNGPNTPARVLCGSGYVESHCFWSTSGLSFLKSLENE